MKPELSIKLAYLAKRQDPAGIFEAMSLYINAYRDLGQLLSESVGVQTDFDFQLNDIEKSSILSKLSAIPGKLDQIFEAAFYNSGNDLFKELTDTNSTESEEQVDELAVNLESSLAGNLPKEIADPYIDRQTLAFVLTRFSEANQKMLNGESVTLEANGDKKRQCDLNTSWRFNNNPKEMFQGETESKELTDKLYVKVAVNEGNTTWSFRSITLNMSFKAKITQQNWITRYQEGLIPPIGPKDIIEALVTLEIYTPPTGKGSPRIRNAKVIDIINIIRHSGHQYELNA